MPTADEIINAYVRIRDQKKELTDRHKQELAPFNEKLGKLEAGLLSILSANGSESLRVRRVRHTSQSVPALRPRIGIRSSHSVWKTIWNIC